MNSGTVLSLAALTSMVLTATGHGAGAPAAPARATIGAYYFDGWSGKTDKVHVTELLKTDYASRKPVWGWYDNTVEIMQQQVDYAADHDISFWAFDWYYPEGADKTSPLNDALGLFLKAKNRDRMKFCLLVANHAGFRIGPKDWDACCRIWIDLFRQPTHLRVDGKPLLIIYSPHELQTAFGTPEGVKKALDALQEQARAAALPGVTVAACTSPGAHPELVQAGYKLLTGYNYGGTWMDGAGAKPFRSLIESNRNILEKFAATTPLPYMPVITVGWDRRPWEQGVHPPEKMSGWYPDRSPAMVEEFVRLGVGWVNAHPDKTPAEKLVLLYAWNENGEGGYLTPTESEGTEYLKAVQRAVRSPQAK